MATCIIQIMKFFYELCVVGVCFIVNTTKAKSINIGNGKGTNEPYPAELPYSSYGGPPTPLVDIRFQPPLSSIPPLLHGRPEHYGLQSAIHPEKPDALPSIPTRLPENIELPLQEVPTVTKTPKPILAENQKLPSQEFISIEGNPKVPQEPALLLPPGLPNLPERPVLTLAVSSNTENIKPLPAIPPSLSEKSEVTFQGVIAEENIKPLPAILPSFHEKLEAPLQEVSNVPEKTEIYQLTSEHTEPAELLLPPGLPSLPEKPAVSETVFPSLSVPENLVIPSQGGPYAPELAHSTYGGPPVHQVPSEPIKPALLPALLPALPSLPEKPTFPLEAVPEQNIQKTEEPIQPLHSTLPSLPEKVEAPSQGVLYIPYTTDIGTGGPYAPELTHSTYGGVPVPQNQLSPEPTKPALLPPGLPNLPQRPVFPSAAVSEAIFIPDQPTKPLPSTLPSLPEKVEVPSQGAPNTSESGPYAPELTHSSYGGTPVNQLTPEPTKPLLPTGLPSLPERPALPEEPAKPLPSILPSFPEKVEISFEGLPNIAEKGGPYAPELSQSTYGGTPIPQNQLSPETSLLPGLPDQPTKPLPSTLPSLPEKLEVPPNANTPELTHSTHGGTPVNQMSPEPTKPILLPGLPSLPERPALPEEPAKPSTLPSFPEKVEGLPNISGGPYAPELSQSTYGGTPVPQNKPSLTLPTGSNALPEEPTNPKLELPLQGLPNIRYPAELPHSTYGVPKINLQPQPTLLPSLPENLELPLKEPQPFHIPKEPSTGLPSLPLPEILKPDIIFPTDLPQKKPRSTGVLSFDPRKREVEPFLINFQEPVTSYGTKIYPQVKENLGLEDVKPQYIPLMYIAQGLPYDSTENFKKQPVKLPPGVLTKEMIGPYPTEVANNFYGVTMMNPMMMFSQITEPSSS